VRYTCGCKMPYADPGVARNLTEKNLQEEMKTKAAAGADVKNVRRRNDIRSSAIE
jgi:hypothetical protein